MIAPLNTCTKKTYKGRISGKLMAFNTGGETHHILVTSDKAPVFPPLPQGHSTLRT